MKNLTINNELSNPTAFFEFNGEEYALDLVEHTLHDGEDMIGEPVTMLDFDVEQDFDAEETLFVFETFTLIYSGSEISVA